MIYLPHCGFIKIDTPVPKELPACSPSFLLKQQSLTFLPSHNKPHGLASAEGLGLACTKVMHPAFVQHCGPIPLQHQWELLVAGQQGTTALLYSSASPFSSCVLEEISLNSLKADPCAGGRTFPGLLPDSFTLCCSSNSSQSGDTCTDRTSYEAVLHVGMYMWVTEMKEVMLGASSIWEGTSCLPLAQRCPDLQLCCLGGS